MCLKNTEIRDGLTADFLPTPVMVDSSILGYLISLNVFSVLMFYWGLERVVRISILVFCGFEITFFLFFNVLVFLV